MAPAEVPAAAGASLAGIHSPSLHMPLMVHNTSDILGVCFDMDLFISIWATVFNLPNLLIDVSNLDAEMTGILTPLTSWSHRSLEGPGH